MSGDGVLGGERVMVKIGYGKEGKGCMVGEEEKGDVGVWVLEGLECMGGGEGGGFYDGEGLLLGGGIIV